MLWLYWKNISKKHFFYFSIKLNSYPGFLGVNHIYSEPKWVNSVRALLVNIYFFEKKKKKEETTIQRWKSHGRNGQDLPTGHLEET